MLNKLFDKAKQDFNKLNMDFEQLSKKNKNMSSKISRSIQDKSEQLSLRKEEREKMFDSIRKK